MRQKTFRLRGTALAASWTATNWTFGVWWGVIGRRNCYGLDIGPFELTLRRRAK